MNLFLRVSLLVKMSAVAVLAVVFLSSFSAISHAEIVMFEQKRCPACKDFKKRLGHKYRYKRVRVHTKAYRKYRKKMKYGVNFVPTFIKFKNGREVGRIGYGSKKAFLKNIKKLRRK